MSLERLAIVQGIYFLVTGAWPIAHIRSFVWVTGPKTDLWLVKTTGALISCIGFNLFICTQDRSTLKIAVTLGVSSAAALMLADIIYAGRKIISKIYLLDAILEAMFIILWIFLIWP